MTSTTKNYLTGLALLGLLFLPLYASAALININTADTTLLDTLPGIGPAKAQAIVDYRTKNGAFARTEDIQNVSGIGAATYADIAPFITVGTAATPPASTPLVASATTTSSAEGGKTSAYTASAAALTIEAGADLNVVAKIRFSLTALPKQKGGGAAPLARVRWSFGDGTSAEGTTVMKTYPYTGTYLVTVTAIDGEATARDDLVVRVLNPAVRIVRITEEGILLANDSYDRLDLSGWRVASSHGTFYVPDGTQILPESTVLFSFEAMRLPLGIDVTLQYPDGTAAARFIPEAALPPPVSVALQPEFVASSSPLVQTVESAFTSPVIRDEDEAIAPPSAPAKPVAQGAAVALAAPEAPEASASGKSMVPGFLRSTWTWGLLGTMLAAAGAFIFW